MGLRFLIDICEDPELVSKTIVKCTRCGLCCVVPNEKGEPVPCKYLGKALAYEQQKTCCLIYENRIGSELVPGVFCTMRERTGVDYPGCPYNNNRPIHPAYKK